MQDIENNYWALFDGGMTSTEVLHPGWEMALQNGINKWEKFRDVWQNDRIFFLKKFNIFTLSWKGTERGTQNMRKFSKLKSNSYKKVVVQSHWK